MTDHKYHFISGLPRSGSTLLSAILRQNPSFYAGIISPVQTFFSGMLGHFSVGSEFGPIITQAQRRNLLRGLFTSFYDDFTDKRVIFDTSRAWSAKLPALHDLFPEAKVIACVRNVAWVMDSIERKYRENPYENTRLFNDDIERNTVYSRVDTLGQRNRLVGYAWSALKEAYYSEHAGALLLVDYDLLCHSPKKVISLIYQFIGEPEYAHDFNNLIFDAPEFDSALGVNGLHRVRKQVSFEARTSILPPDLFESYSNMSFWLDRTGSAANVITVKNGV